MRLAVALEFVGPNTQDLLGPVPVNRVGFVMSADVRFAVNSGPIDWPLPAHCRVPPAVEGDLLVGRAGPGRGARALTLALLPW